MCASRRQWCPQLFSGGNAAASHDAGGTPYLKEAGHEMNIWTDLWLIQLHDGVYVWTVVLQLEGGDQ